MVQALVSYRRYRLLKPIDTSDFRQPQEIVESIGLISSQDVQYYIGRFKGFNARYKVHDNGVHIFGAKSALQYNCTWSPPPERNTTMETKLEDVPSGMSSRARDTKSTANLFRSSSNAKASSLKSKRPPG
jgi:hypothetical protein